MSHKNPTSPLKNPPSSKKQRPEASFDFGPLIASKIQYDAGKTLPSVSRNQHPHSQRLDYENPQKKLQGSGTMDRSFPALPSGSVAQVRSPQRPMISATVTKPQGSGTMDRSFPALPSGSVAQVSSPQRPMTSATVTKPSPEDTFKVTRLGAIPKKPPTLSAGTNKSKMNHGLTEKKSFSPRLSEKRVQEVGFGLKPTEKLPKFTLPTNEDILRRIHFIKAKSVHNRSLLSIAEEIWSEVAIIYNKIPCKMVFKNYGLNQIVSLSKDFWYYSKPEKQNQPGALEFKENLPKLFNFIGQNAVSAIQNDPNLSERQKSQDIGFLNDQKGPRKMMLGSRDVKYVQKHHQPEPKPQTEHHQPEPKPQTEQHSDSSESQTDNELDVDSDYELPRIHNSTISKQMTKLQSNVTKLQSNVSLLKSEVKEYDLLKSQVKDMKDKLQNVTSDPVLLSTLDRTKTSSVSGTRIIAATVKGTYPLLSRNFLA